ncbi:hypothetical protein L2E82_33697 [Cichorium intybus]|uniref:Uncharacterized protein n=1 Tax=Cichorium intybus TaxID=13427 RepID=A0ACB9BKV7_CICIN|nr:hypothetical protein L2E82_33697 [Cichorium intybus]
MAVYATMDVDIVTVDDGCGYEYDKEDEDEEERLLTVVLNHCCAPKTESIRDRNERESGVERIRECEGVPTRDVGGGFFCV